MIAPSTRAGFVLLAIVGATTALASTLGDDPEERADHLARGKRIFQDNCLICHSAELSEGQAITEAQWSAEVEKMIGWGAPVAKDEREDLQRYLTESFVHRDHVPPPSRMAPDRADEPIRPESGANPLDDADPAKGASLFAAQCASCHGKDGRGAEVGNNLVEKPVLLRPSEFHRVVHEGRHKMPSFRIALTSTQEGEILAWLRRQIGTGPWN